MDACSPPAPAQPGRDGDARPAARDRPAVARRAALRPTHRTHGSVPLQPRRHDRRRRQDGSCDAGAIRGARARRDADRADLGSRALLPRRRQPGPRRGRAPSLRRSQLAVHRRLRRAADVPVRNGHRPRGRLLRGARRRRAVPAPRRRLGLPRLPVRDLPLDGPGDPEPRRGTAQARGGQPGAADLHHRDRLHPVRGPVRQRRGAVAAGNASSSRPRSGSARRPGACCGATSCRTS